MAAPPAHKSAPPDAGKQDANKKEGYDLIIVGGGPGGYVAAIRAAQLGLKVACVEREHLGGICANWGCIPTKALLHSAEVYAAVQHGSAYGIVAGGARFDFQKAIEHSRKVADNQQKGVGFLFKKNKIEHIRDSATLVRDGKGVRLRLKDGRELSAPHVMLATGARPKTIPGLTPDGKRVLTYFEAMNLPAQPSSIVVVGAGAIGVEFAYFYAAIGTQVTLLEALPQILPVEDKEISQLLQRSLRGQGISIHTGARFQSVANADEKGEKLLVKFADEKGEVRELVCDKVLSAVGVRGNIDGLGLEQAGVAVERGFIAVDEWYRVKDGQGKGDQAVAGLYAIGDVIGGPLLAHKASAEGICCVEKIAGVAEREIRRVDYSSMPGATFCRPEVGSMGLTEDKARELGKKILVGKFPFKVSGKAQATGETDGLVKVILDEATGEILGAHILGGTASDMISALTLARRAELTATEILHTVFPHPTYGEVLKGAVEAAYGEAIDL
jgi:dihydrolipoamide dehydrogenase